jgi:putative ABC transport system substrate-binding protein
MAAKGGRQMNNRRKLVIAIGASALAIPLFARAQQTDRIRRIGVLQQYAATDTEGQRRTSAFLMGLQELGWKEGQNFSLEIRYANGMFERAPALVAELLQAHVDVLVTAGTETVEAARNATKTVPIIMATIGDPVGAGIIASLARPGGNITGLCNYAKELSAKRLELIAEIIPGMGRVAVLWNPNNASVMLKFKETEEAARVKGIQVESIPVRHPDEIDQGFQRARQAGVKAIVIADDVLLSSQRGRIVELAMRNRLPMTSEFTQFADAGALMSYGPDQIDMWRRAALFVNKILKGAKPADLPVEQPTRFEMVINMKTAKTLGVKIPNSILVRADRVIE